MTATPISGFWISRGDVSRSSASLHTNTPDRAMMTPWINAARPSDLPCPNLCSASAGESENRTAQNVSPDARVSSSESARDDSSDTDPVACIVWLGDIVQPQVPFLTAICPSCDGSGRRADTSSGLRDVTKTKPSHYRPAAAAAAGPKGPVTSEGLHVASEANASAIFPADAKTRLLVEIMNHEATHGRCTRTFIKKIRKQTRPAP